MSLRHLLNPEPLQSHSPPPLRRNNNPPPTRQRTTPPPRIPYIPDSDFESDEFFTLEDSEEDDTANMPATTRNTRRHSIVDLTETPDTNAPPLRRKRESDTDEEGGGGPARKRGRRTTRGPRDVDYEEIDLADEDEKPSAEEELLQAQQKATIRQQQAEVAAGPQRLGKLQCIICMEGYTDATATSCGTFHLRRTKGGEGIC
jgi:hypothetical protein